MTETADTQSQVWTPNGFRDDGWRHAESAEALEGNGGVILPLAVWKALDPEVREAERDRIGVLIAPGEDIAEIVDGLSSIPLVALAFPAFNDGRSFSKAALLRSRHGYESEIRACGEVLIDLIPHMLRTGFDAMEVADKTALARLAAGRVGGIALHYQPAAKAAAPGAGYSWRRRPAA